jgi:hypothetical protein
MERYAELRQNQRLFPLRITMTPGEAAAVRKVHASLNVSDLDRSVGFYRVLLG